jgi:hypothetical protein
MGVAAKRILKVALQFYRAMQSRIFAAMSGHALLRNWPRME